MISITTTPTVAAATPMVALSPANSGSKSEEGRFIPNPRDELAYAKAVADAVAITSTLSSQFCAESRRKETNFSVPSML